MKRKSHINSELDKYKDAATESHTMLTSWHKGEKI